MNEEKLRKRARELEVLSPFREGGQCDLCNLMPKSLIGLGELNPEAKRGVGRTQACPTCLQRVLVLLVELFRDDLREDLAAVAHEMWSGWMEYMLRVVVDHNEGRVSTRVKIERWRRQMETLYADLPSNEQESDREQADKMLAALTGTEESDEFVESKWTGSGIFTSARINIEGPHDKVRLWNRGGLAGELVLQRGDGVAYLLMLGLEEDSGGELGVRREDL